LLWRNDSERQRFLYRDDGKRASLGGSLLRLTLKGMISFLAIGSREEDNSTMGEKRLGWNEEGGRQGSIYIERSSCSRCQNIIPIGSIQGNMRMDPKYT
jgi:hypothetical protein